MKKSSSTVIVIILSIVAIVVIVASLLNARAPAEVIPTSTGTQAATPTASVTATPDPCAPANIQSTVLELDKISREFSDAFVLAQNTPAVKLSPVISEMQEIRRRAEDFTIPPCLTTLKEYQLGFMNTAINTSLLLYSSISGDPNQPITQEQVNVIVTKVNQLMTEANEYASKYRIEMARVLGVTLTPSPISTSTETTTALGPTATP